MSDHTDISPWAHPKAQMWFETVFDRSGLLLELRDSIIRNDPPLNRERRRLIISMLILMGRPGIWPSNQQSMFRQIVELILENHQADNGKAPPSLTIEEHKRYSVVTEAYTQELEVLKRIAGLSQRRSPVKQPSAWRGFWTS